MNKKLYRSDENKILLGVCGGIGEYFNIDPVIIRLILVVLIFLGFSGIIAYIIGALIIPRNPNVSYYPPGTYNKTEVHKDSAKQTESQVDSEKTED